MKKLLFVILLITIPFLTFAKSKNQSTQKNLEWIFSPYSVYPEKDYFAAVGSAKNKSESELEAVEKIASIFGQNVVSKKESEMNSTHHEVGDDFSETFVDSSLSVQIQTEINQKDLIGIEVKESYYDETHNIWYTLAILNKEKTSGLYVDLIQKNMDSIKQLKGFADSKNDSLEKFACLYKSAILASENESYFQRFYIINPQKCDSLKNKLQSSVELKLKANQVAEKIPFAIKLSSTSYNKEIKNACAEVLESFGFLIEENSPFYELNVELQNNVRAVNNPEMFYSEFTFILEIRNHEKIYVSWNKTGRAGGKTQELSEQKMRQVICSSIKTEYVDSLENYFYGEIK